MTILLVVLKNQLGYLCSNVHKDRK